MKKLFYYLFALILFAACNRDRTDPAVEFSMPATGDQFATEAMFRVKAKITDDGAIKKVTYKIYQRIKEYFPGTVSFELEELETMSNIGGGTLDIYVIAEDNAGNVTEKKITVKHKY